MQSGNLPIVLITWCKLPQNKGLAFNALILRSFFFSLKAIIVKIEVEHTSMTGKLRMWRTATFSPQFLKDHFNSEIIHFAFKYNVNGLEFLRLRMVKKNIIPSSWFYVSRETAK